MKIEIFGGILNSSSEKANTSNCTSKVKPSIHTSYTKTSEKASLKEGVFSDEDNTI